MRILLINQFFWPDSSATSQLLTDLAKGLSERGHSVDVICADSTYNVASGDSPPAVQVFRVRTSGFSRGRVGRILSYLSFYISAALRAVSLSHTDLVLTLTTPPLISILGTILKARAGCRHFIWEMDVYPDVATDLNYFKPGGLIDRVTGALADYSRRHADGIIALGECMKDRLIARGIDGARVFVADNWADGDAIQPIPRGGDPSKLVLLYSGNLGLAHDLETLQRAMLELNHDNRFQFLFVGSGGRRQELASFAAVHDIRSVELRPYVERSSLGESLSAGDIGLVTQRDVCCGSVVPSKMYGILAAGRPVLYIGPRRGNPALIIDRFKCGWQVDCGDVGTLTKLLLHLADHPEEVSLAGRKARQALLRHYDLPVGVERIANILGAGSIRCESLGHEPVLAVESL